MTENEKIILEFIKKHTLATIATVDSSDSPQAAVLEFSETDNLELIFDTFSTYRKYINIQNNPKVALVIGWDNDITVQYEGIAFELKGDEIKKYQNIHVAKLPKAKKFVDMDVVRYFKVTPKWIRYSDLSVNPWNVFEVNYP